MMLLSDQKKGPVSSAQVGHGAELAVDENVRTWWSAATANPGEYLQIDLGDVYAVHAVQVNLADGDFKPPKHDKAEMGGDWYMRRYIETQKMVSRYVVEGSPDGERWFMLEDKRDAESACRTTSSCTRRASNCAISKSPGSNSPTANLQAQRAARVGEGKGARRPRPKQRPSAPAT
jgi:hypothetical protein